jgi:hypothetical protein
MFSMICSSTTWGRAVRGGRSRQRSDLESDVDIWMEVRVWRLTGRVREERERENRERSIGRERATNLFNLFSFGLLFLWRISLATLRSFAVLAVATELPLDW